MQVPDENIHIEDRRSFAELETSIQKTTNLMVQRAELRDARMNQNIELESERLEAHQE